MVADLIQNHNVSSSALFITISNNSTAVSSIHLSHSFSKFHYSIKSNSTSWNPIYDRTFSTVRSIHTETTLRKQKHVNISTRLQTVNYTLQHKTRGGSKQPDYTLVNHTIQGGLTGCLITISGRDHHKTLGN